MRGVFAERKLRSYPAKPDSRGIGAARDSGRRRKGGGRGAARDSGRRRKGGGRGMLPFAGDGLETAPLS